MVKIRSQPKEEAEAEEEEEAAEDVEVGNNEKKEKGKDIVHFTVVVRIRPCRFQQEEGEEEKVKEKDGKDEVGK